MTDSEFPLVQFMRDGFDPDAELARIRAEQPVFPMAIPRRVDGYLVTRWTTCATCSATMSVSATTSPA